MSLRIIWAVTLVVAIALPAMARDEDSPQIDVAVGYANLTVPSYVSPLSGINYNFGREHRSGLSIDVGWYPVPWFGIDDYTGVYPLEYGDTLFTNIPGGKIVGRNLLRGRVVPYGVAGFGFGVFAARGPATKTLYTSWSGAARYGVGTDVQLTTLAGVRIEASRMALHQRDWSTNWNMSTGVIFRLR